MTNAGVHKHESVLYCQQFANDGNISQFFCFAFSSKRRFNSINSRSTKKSQDYVKIVGFYHPSHSRPILTPGIQICSQKWSQVNISIGYSYISQVKILYKVKFSKLEICQSDCRFKILAKNCVKKVSFFFQNFDQNIVKIDIFD